MTHVKNEAYTALLKGLWSYFTKCVQNKEIMRRFIIMEGTQKLLHILFKVNG